MVEATLGYVGITGDLNTVLRHASRPFMRAIRDSIEDEIDRTIVRDSGYLATTTFVKLNERTGQIDVGATADYAAAYEDGYVHHSSHRFIPGHHTFKSAVLKYTHGRIGR